MSAKWKKEYQPAPVLELVDDSITVGRDRKTLSGGFGAMLFLKHAETYVLHALQMDAEISESDRAAIVNGAIEGAKTKGTLSPNAVLARANAQEQKFLAQPRELYVLCTALSASVSGAPERKGAEGARLTFTAALPKRFRVARDGAPRSSALSPNVDVPAGFTAVRVAVRARSTAEAVENALDALDYLRGIWNLRLNWRGGRLFAGLLQPVNRILSGPFHSLHHPSGDLAADHMWYEESVHNLAGISPIQPGSWTSALHFETQVRAELRRSRFADLAKSCLQRYARALDETRFDVAYLRLWGLIETLTNTEKKASDQTVKRALFASRGDPVDRELIRLLRQLRHRSAHTGTESQYIKTLVDQLRPYVENLLIFLIFHSRPFESMEELGQVLDLPTDPKLLKRNMMLRQIALELLSD